MHTLPQSRVGARSDQTLSSVHRPMQPPLLTIPEFHRALGGAVGINAVRTLVNTGRIRSVSLGLRKRVIPSSELNDWPARETAVTN